jgi:hypothetical protein
MGLLGDLGLAAARRARAGRGDRAALRLLEPLVQASEPSRGRAEATAVALECAIELGDRAAIESLSTAWRRERDVPPDVVERLCARCLARRDPDAAAILADAEIERRDGPAARALRASIAEARGDRARAIVDQRAAVERGGDRVELARLLLQSPGGRLEAAGLVRDVEPSSPRARLVTAIARLGERGRYARTRGLDVLVELAGGRDAALARAAIRAACAHVDELGPAATAVEIDRVRRAIALWPDASERERAIARLDALGADEVPLAADAAMERASRLLGDEPALRAIAAIRSGRYDDARSALRALAAPEGMASAARWTACALALEVPSLRADAAALAAAWMASPFAPPRGFVHLSERLAAAGEADLALRALARAHERHERGARDAHVAALVREAWRAHADGRRDDAITLLRRARALGR